MCGLAGFLDASGEKDGETLRAVALRMAATLYHRGPDDWGAWVDAAAGVAMGFRRLAILDLSPLGRQPMCSAGGRYVLAFNGEIYNHQALRRELERTPGAAARFRGHSDTEVLLAAVEGWGLEPAVRRLVGMFAFALWDRKERRLHLVRDRLGEKPLYYGWMGRSFLFGSELKALRRHPDFRGEVNRDALVPFLRHGYIPTPCSIYRDIHKLPPGTMLSVRGQPTGALPAPVPYWSAKEVAEAGTANPFAGGEAEAVAELERLLGEAVRDQMVADVPLGAFLSGGVDSSTVVALMQAQSARPIRTFAIGFHEAGYDEAVHARAVAQHLGTDHTELYVTPAEALGVIPRLPSLNDEPFGDASQIPVFLVSQLARQAVTVCLSGDGGDELFGGYQWYYQPGRIWNKLRWLPRRLRGLAASALTGLSAQRWDRALRPFRPVLPSRLARHFSGDKVYKLADMVSRAEGPESVYQSLVFKWGGPACVVLGAREPRTALTDRSRWAELDDLRRRLMSVDVMTYLPDNHMTKVDRASMGVSLEARAPFLDHRVAEFAWRLPASLMARDGRGKYLLRQVLHRHVPAGLVERPKMGFPVPIDSWLRGPLREWADELLDERRLAREGFFDPAPVRQKWTEHLSGSRNWQWHLWHVLMFQGWLEAVGGRAAPEVPVTSGV